jgi:hypothetical protein
MTTSDFRTDREDIVHEDVYIEEIDESGMITRNPATPSTRTLAKLDEEVLEEELLEDEDENEVRDRNQR